MKRQNITRRPDHFSSAFLDGSGTNTSPMKYATNDGSASVRQFRRRTSSVPWRHGTVEQSPDDDDDGNVMRLRTFTIDPKAGKLINRGDSYRSLNNGSRSDSCAGSLESNSKDGILSRCQSPPSPVTRYNILVLGIDGVGKTVTINQFMTSDYCNFFTNEMIDDRIQNSVYVRLDDEEFELTFVEVDIKGEIDDWLNISAAGYLVLYSVDDRISFKKACEVVQKLKRHQKNTSIKPIVLVGNKIDLERKRAATTEEGKMIAKENNCKFIEISVAIGHKVDELLVGILNQIRHQRQQIKSENSGQEKTDKKKSFNKKHFYSKQENSVSCISFSLTGRNLLNKILSRNKTLSKSVEDLLSLTI